MNLVDIFISIRGNSIEVILCINKSTVQVRVKFDIDIFIFIIGYKFRGTVFHHTIYVVAVTSQKREH